MQRREIDPEVSRNREAAYGADEPVRDDRNLVEKARDAVVGSADRTRVDSETVRTTNGAESEAQYPSRRTDAIGAQTAGDRDARVGEPRDTLPGGVAISRDTGVAASDSADSTRTSTAAQNLLPSGSLDRFQSRWQQIQTGFVDEPRTAVRDAEALVGDMVSELTAVFTRERQNLEQHWDRGAEASTEDLRVALQRYRSFFQRLLAA